MTNRTLPEWLDFISNTHPSEIEMGLDRVKAVYRTLNLNSQNIKLVLVAGTNGKGSTIAMIEASLLSLGYKVGAYTSPHILSYNERVRINGSNVIDDVLAQSFERIEEAREGTPLTYFEYGTLAAFDILLSEGLDVILLEIGLGGRLDAVNIVDPDISIITSIGIDHSDWLGTTLDAIGIEKAGVLRKNSLFIGGEGLPASVLGVSRELSCQELLCRQEFNVLDSNKDCVKLVSADKSRQFNGFPVISLPENNILIALQAVASLYHDLKAKDIDQQVYTAIVNVIDSLKLSGRLEKIELKDNSEFYIDVGHNPHAAEYLSAFLSKKALSGKKVQIVYSSLIDKDALGIMQILSPLVDRCLLAPLEVDRAMSLECLMDYADKSKMKSVLVFTAIDKAIESALSYSFEAKEKKESVITLIFGSFYIVEAAKRFFNTYD